MDETGKELLKSMSLDDLRELKRDVDAEINRKLEQMVSAYGTKR